MWRAAWLILALAVSQPAPAQEGTIRIVLGFPAGASAQLLTRLLADQMRTALGQLANEAVKSAAIMKRDYEKWGPVVRASGFRPEN